MLYNLLLGYIVALVPVLALGFVLVIALVLTLVVGFVLVQGLGLRIRLASPLRELGML